MVDYLYPDRDVQVLPSMPVLRVPINVGVAFVPGYGKSARFHQSGGLSEKEKRDLLEQTAQQFKELEIIERIEIIPSTYLRPGGGFDNLDQLRGMFGVDVIALLSYDQIQYTDEGFFSLAYWTIVGAYLIKGEKNDTNTVMDATVYDIPSRKLLFRAPGTSNVKASSTRVNLSEQLRENSREGFSLATEDLVTNLQAELELFKQKVKEAPEAYAVEYKPGYTGAGSMGPVFSFLFVLIGILAWSRSKVQ